MEGTERIGARNWTLIWIIGMIGQLVWNVENSLFNTFVYRVADKNAEIIIQWMVAASATATTISTLLIGTWSDRIGKRRPFIGFGYILWGIFTIGFGATRFLPVMYIGAALIITDVFMSFCGSVGNDAGFNAWTTDITTVHNRGRLGGALAVMPVIATIVGTAGFGIVVDGIKGSPFSGIGYFPFFIVIGIIAMLVGIFSLCAVREGPALKPAKEGKGYWIQFAEAFRLKEFMKNRELFWVFIVMVTYFIGFNVYFPFIMPYFEHTLGLGLGLAGIITGAGLGLAVVFTIPAARFIDRGKGSIIIILAVVVNLIGLFIISFAEGSQIPLLILGTLGAGTGYVLVLQTLTAWVKNLYPDDRRGQYEGIRLIFFVCLPMVIGPAIGTPLVTNFGKALLIDGRHQMVPGGLLFQVSAVVTFLSLLPLLGVWKVRRRQG
ncbi:MAG: MFS transporter [Spirochaetales bacterium]|nr:MFS transporter [Spirochaetales bacterium]